MTGKSSRGRPGMNGTDASLSPRTADTEPLVSTSGMSFTTVMYRQAQIQNPLYLNSEGPVVMQTVNVDCETYPDLFDELFELSQSTKHLHYAERAHLILTAHSRFVRKSGITHRSRRSHDVSDYVYEHNKMRRSYSEGNFIGIGDVPSPITPLSMYKHCSVISKSNRASQ